MKKKTTIITILIVSILVCTIFVLPKGTFGMLYKQYKLINKDTYHVKVGETFEINLNQNYTTGYTNCWLNENQVESIKMIKYHFKIDNNDKDIDGSGGLDTYTFKAIKAGKDTIKFKSCPSLRENKDCKDYTFKDNEIDEMFKIIVTE